MLAIIDHLYRKEYEFSFELSRDHIRVALLDHRSSNFLQPHNDIAEIFLLVKKQSSLLEHLLSNEVAKAN